MSISKYKHKGILIRPKTHLQRIAVLVHNYLWFESCAQCQHVTNFQIRIHSHPIAALLKVPITPFGPSED